MLLRQFTISYLESNAQRLKSSYYLINNGRVIIHVGLDIRSDTWGMRLMVVVSFDLFS